MINHSRHSLTQKYFRLSFIFYINDKRKKVLVFLKNINNKLSKIMLYSVLVSPGSWCWYIEVSFHSNIWIVFQSPETTYSGLKDNSFCQLKAKLSAWIRQFILYSFWKVLKPPFRISVFKWKPKIMLVYCDSILKHLIEISVPFCEFVPS